MAAQEATGRSQKVNAMQAEVNAHNPGAVSAGAPMDISGGDYGAAADVPSEMGAHSWSQDDEEITVEVLVPAGTTSKQIKVEFKPTHIKAQVLTLAEGQQEVLNKALGGKAEPEECTWGLTDAAKGGRQLTITIAKHYTMQGEWAAAFA